VSRDLQDRGHERPAAAGQADGQLAARQAPADRAVILDELIAALPDGFALFDPAGRHLEVNDALCAMTGCSRAELLAAVPPFPFWPPEDAESIGEAFAAFLEGKARTHELTFMRRDGERFPVLVTPTIVSGDDGAMRVGLVTFKDMSRQRHAEQALAARETDYQALVENIREVFARYDLDLRFTYVSPVVTRWMSLDPRKMVGLTNLEAGFPEELAALFDAMLRRALETRDQVSFEYRIQGYQGELVAESHVYPEFDAEGNVKALMSINYDITARTRAEEALRESEAKYRSVVERAHDAVLIIDAHRVLLANDAASRLSGFSPDELQGLPIAVVMPAAGRDQLLDRARRRIAGEELPPTYITELLRKDGTAFTAELSAGVITYEGEPANLLLVREVTERERAAEALRRSEAMRDTAERVARVGSYSWDLTTQEVTYSPELFRLFDIDPEAFDGEFMSAITSRVHPDDRARLVATIDAFRSTGLPQPLDHRVVHRDGTVRVLHGETFVAPGQDGRPGAMVGYYRDVTEEREQERLLRQAEERYRALFEQSPVSIWEQDISVLIDGPPEVVNGGIRSWAEYLASHPDLAGEIRRAARLLQANGASVELFGAADERELVADFTRCLTPEGIALFAQVAEAVASGASRFAGRGPFRRLDGELRIMDVFVSVVENPAPRAGSVLISFVDVTETVRAEAEVRRLNAELEERVASRTAQRDALNRELESFAYSVSHDVRAPLRAIDGFSAMVLEDAAGRLSDDDVEHLRRVRDAAQRMGGLIDDLLGLSRISRRDLVRSEVDVSAVAAAVGAELAAEHPARRVVLDVAPGLTAHVDPTLVRVILRELLENAWKFTAGKDEAHVEVGCGTGKGSTPAFFVRDDGAGFDPRFAGHLFGAFQRLHHAAQFPGNGIGLATVQRLVARHGGSVWAESTPGEGATFFFTLPDPLS
jgi:PAS domain S-box-containing protein